jgi:hypothetical protein
MVNSIPMLFCVQPILLCLDREYCLALGNTAHGSNRRKGRIFTGYLEPTRLVTRDMIVFCVDRQSVDIVKVPGSWILRKYRIVHKRLLVTGGSERDEIWRRDWWRWNLAGERRPRIMSQNRGTKLRVYACIFRLWRRRSVTRVKLSISRICIISGGR